MAPENNSDTPEVPTPESGSVAPQVPQAETFQPQTVNQPPEATPSPQPISPIIAPPPAATISIPTPAVTPPSTVNTAPTTTTPSVNVVAPPANPSSVLPATQHKSRFKMKNVVIICGLVVLFIAALSGAYILGKQHQKIIIQQPARKPINLPPQAVVTANCVAGRGKQYILPKDIPGGPIYDVVNSNVIAIEYNLNIADIQSNPDSLSDSMLKLTRDYPVDHFSLVPVTPKAGEALQYVHLIMFVVTKDDANKITCSAAKP